MPFDLALPETSALTPLEWVESLFVLPDEAGECGCDDSSDAPSLPDSLIASRVQSAYQTLLRQHPCIGTIDATSAEGQALYEAIGYEAALMLLLSPVAQKFLRVEVKVEQGEVVNAWQIVAGGKMDYAAAWRLGGNLALERVPCTQAGKKVKKGTSGSIVGLNGIRRSGGDRRKCSSCGLLSGCGCSKRGR